MAFVNTKAFVREGSSSVEVIGPCLLIPFWILDFGFSILKVSPIGSFGNSNVARIKQNGITINERFQK